MTMAAAGTNPLGGRLDSMDAVGGPMSGFSETTLLTAVFGAWEVAPAIKVLLEPVSCEPSDHLLLYDVKNLRNLTAWDTGDVKEFLTSLKIPATLRFSLEKVVSTILARSFTFERECLPPPPAADPVVRKKRASNYHDKLWAAEAGKQSDPVQMQDIAAWAIPEALIEQHTSLMSCLQTLMTPKQASRLATDVLNWFICRSANAYPSKQHFDLWEMQLSRLAPLAPWSGRPRSWGTILSNRSGNGRSKKASVRARWHHPARPALALPPSDHTCANHLSQSPH